MAQSSSVNHCYGVASLCFVLALQLFNILAHEVTNGHANHDYINHRLKELICTQGQRHIWDFFLFFFFLLLDIPEGTCKQDTELTVLINNLYNNQQKCSPCVLRCFHFVFCFFCFFGTLCFTNYTLAGIDLFLLTSMILVLGLNVKVQSILKIILKMFSSHKYFLFLSQKRKTK